MKSLIYKGLIITTMASALAVTGCATNNGGYGGMTEDQAKVLAGSVIGGVIGAQTGKGQGKTAMTVIGALIGGYIGASMSNQSRQRVNYALNDSSDYQQTTWTDPQNNTQYRVTPTDTYNASVNGQQSVCRDYTMDAWIDGRMQQVKGRACRDSSGQWVAVR